MNRYILILFCIIHVSCYTKYGVVLEEDKNHYIPSKPHINYEITRYRSESPKSIIFII